MSNIFNLFGSKTPAHAAGKQPYKACTVSERECGDYGLVLHYEDGETDLVLYYAYLMRVVAASPDMLYLICTDCVYTLYGKNLNPLLPLLCHHKIRSLHAFNPQKHPALTADNHEMVIESIIMESTAAFWEEHDKREAIRQPEAQQEEAARVHAPAPPT